jgi:hypothetical protein
MHSFHASLSKEAQAVRKQGMRIVNGFIVVVMGLGN